VSDIIDEAPPSLGALAPAPVGRNKFLLPVAPEESFWIGLSSRDSTCFCVAILANLGGARPSDLLAGGSCDEDTATWLSVPPRRVVPGITTDAHFRVFTRTGANQHDLKMPRFLARRCDASQISAVACQLDLVDYASYSARTGLSAPDVLNREAGYKGYLLP
jgi:hypothetical protein